jgi:hypothetical protein
MLWLISIYPRHIGEIGGVFCRTSRDPDDPITRFFPLASGANRGYHLSCLPIAAHPGAGTRADGREFRIRVCWSSSQVTLEQ